MKIIDTVLKPLQSTRYISKALINFHKRMGFHITWVNYVEGELMKMQTTLYCSPQIDARVHQSAQSRIYSNPMTNEYSKKWNLQICSYQHWFDQICGRIEEAIYKIQYSDEGWHRKDDVMRFSNALIE